MAQDETIENKRKRLIFRSCHRGTKEMDLLLGSFARAHVPDMTERQLEEYDDLLKNNDPDLYNWITAQEEPGDAVPADLLEKLRSHKYAG